MRGKYFYLSALLVFLLSFGFGIFWFHRANQIAIRGETKAPTTLVSKDSSGVFKAKEGETELIDGRTANFKQFKEPDGKVRVAGQIGPIHYKDDPFSTTEQYKEIDLTTNLTPGQSWDAAMETNGYQVHFWQSRTIDGKTIRYIAQYRRAGKWLAMAPVALVWENSSGEQQLISKTQPAGAPTIDNDNYRITWANVFGPGIDFRYNLNPDEFFKTVIINDKADLPAPTINTSGLKLTTVMTLAWDAQTKSANGFASSITTNDLTDDTTGIDNPDEELTNPAISSFKDELSRDVWWLQKPKAWDSAEEQHIINVDHRLRRKGSNIFALLSVPATALNRPEVVYPVYVDSTITEVQTSASADDASMNGVTWPGTGGRDITTNFANVGKESNNFWYNSGTIFRNIPIPQGATVNSATVTLDGWQKNGSPGNMGVYGEAADDAAVYNTTNRGPADVARTTATIPWSIASISGGTWYTSPDISSIVQEVVGRGGWVFGNAFNAVLLPDSGLADGVTNEYRFYTYNANTTYAAKFNATFTVAATGITRTWDGGGGANTNWSTAANWSDDTVPVNGDAVVFDNTSDNSSTVDANFKAAPASISVNAGYDGTITQTNNLYMSGSTGNITVNSGTWAESTYNLNTVGGNLTIGSTLTIGASANNGLTATDLTISGGGALTASGTSKINVSGNYSNSGTFTAGSSTLTMNAAATGKTLAGTMTGTSSFYNLTFNNASGGWTLSNDIKVTNVLNINAGTLDASSKTVELSGTTGTPFVKAGTFTPSTSTFIYSGNYTSGDTFIAAATYNNLQINNASETYTIGSGTVILNGNLTVTAGMFTGTGSVGVNGSVTGNGTINMLGNGAFSTYGTANFGGDTNWTFNSLGINGASKTLTKTGNGNITVNNTLSINNASTTLDAGSTIWTLAGTYGTPFVKTGNFTANASTFIYSGDYGSGNTNIVSTTYWNLQTNNGAETYAAAGALDVNGSLTLTLGTLSMGAYNLNVAGDFLNPGGSFSAGSSTVTLDGVGGSTQTISGNNSFNNLTSTATIARTIKFTGSTTTIVGATWTATGVANQLISLQSTDGNNWTINPAAATVSYVNVSHSTNTGVSSCTIYSNDGGNNNGWKISSGPLCAPDLSSPANGAPNVIPKPQLQLVYTGAGSYFRYKIELDTVNTFNSGDLQTFDQTQSQTGWSGQNTQGGTAYTSGTTATYTLGSALKQNTTYYWRGYVIDPGGENQWSSASAYRSFTIKSAAKLVFTTSAQTLTTGQVSTVMTIELQTADSEEVAASSNTTMNLSSTSTAGRFDTSAGGPFNGTITSITINSGSSSGNFYYKDTANGTPTITAAENPSLGWTDAQQQQTINVGDLEHFGLTGYPSNPTAGNNFGSNNVTVTAEDAYNNLKTDYTGQVWFTSSDTEAVLPYISGSKYTFTSGEGQDNGTHTFAGTGFTLKTAGDQTITLTEGTYSGQSSNITVNPAALDHFTMSGYPSSATAGSAWSSPTNDAIVTAYDTFSNVKTDYTGQVWFTSSDSQAILPYTSGSKYTFTTGGGNDNGTHTFTGSGFTLKTTGDQTITATEGSINIQSSAITVNPAGLDHFVMSGYPSSTTAGNNFGANNITLTAQDSFNNVKTDYTGQVWFTSSDSQAILPYTSGSKYTFTTGGGNDNGIHIFSGNGFTLKMAGNQSITATDGSVSIQSSAISVAPASLDHFNLSSYPNASGGQWVVGGTTWDNIINAGPGAPYSPAVTAKDIYGNTISGFTGNVWFEIQNGYSSNFTYYDTDNSYTFTAGGGGDNGQHIFSGTDFRVDTSGDSVSFYVKSTGVASSFSIKVKPAPLHHFSFSFANGFSTAMVDEALSTPDNDITLTAYDEVGNVKTDYEGSIYFTSTDTSATLPYIAEAKFTFDLLDLGTYIFLGSGFTFGTGGQQTLSAVDSDANITSISSVITVSAHAPSQLQAVAGHEQVTLSWLNPADEAVNHIHIYQSETQGQLGTKIAQEPTAIANQAGQQVITGLTNGTPYYFTLRSVVKKPDNSDWESANSPQVSATPADLAPRDVNALQESDSRVKINYKLRYNSTVTLAYYNPTTASWADATGPAMSGDVGANISGNENLVPHTAYWIAKTDFSEKYYSQTAGFKIKVKVVVSGQNGEAISDSLRLDTKNPTSLSLIVNAIDSNTANLAITAADDSTPMQMMICNTASFSGCSYEDYSTSRNNWNIGTTDKVYLRIKDAYSNTADISNTLSSIVSDFEIKDGSTAVTNNYRLVLLWSPLAGENIQYIVERATDGVTFTVLDTISRTGYLDFGLDKDTTYYYRIKVKDSLGNISRPTTILNSKPGAAPLISNGPKIEIFGWKQDFGIRAKVTWSTDQLTNGFVAYSKESLAPGPATVTASDKPAMVSGLLERTDSHEVMLYNLDPSVKYYYKVISENDIRVAGASDVGSFSTPAKVILTLSGMKSTDLKVDSVTLTWQTSKVATTILEYGQSAGYGATITDTTWNTDHTANLTGLVDGATYHFRVKATDTDENVTFSDDYVLPIPAKPAISGIQVKDISNNQATVTWQTNVNADSNVEFGIDTKYGNQQGKSDLTTVHSVALIGLDSKTLYHFRVKSVDSLSNPVVSNDTTFTTTSDTVAPIISDVKSEISTVGTSPDSAKLQIIISWTTDEPATSLAQFGEGISGESSKSSKEDLNLNMNHVVILSDLKPNTSYHFQIVSKDKSENQAISENYTVLTPPKEKSLMQVIIKALEDTFSWMAKLKNKWFHK